MKYLLTSLVEKTSGHTSNRKQGLRRFGIYCRNGIHCCKSPACKDLRDAREPHRRKKIVNSIKFEASRAYTDLCSTETDTYRLHPAAVVGPVQQGLALFAPAIQVAGRAVFL